MYNWYIENTTILCGDLCIRECRQLEYDKEKMNYVSPLVIIKRDKLFLKKTDVPCRIHEFRKYKMINCSDNIVTVFDKESTANIEIRLRNMDSFFYLNETRKAQMNAALHMHNHV